MFVRLSTIPSPSVTFLKMGLTGGPKTSLGEICWCCKENQTGGKDSIGVDETFAVSLCKTTECRWLSSRMTPEQTKLVNSD